MCKICGNKTVEITINGLKYDFCENCGFLAKSEEYFLDSINEYNRYLKHNNNDDFGYIEYQKKFLNEIREFLGENNLDFGCGDNHILANILNENGYFCSFYDLYFYPHEEYEKRLYDAIILEEVIEHLKDPISVLKHLVNLVKSDGVLIIRTQFIIDDVFNKNWWYLRDSTHISFFDEKTFSFICKLFSLSIIYCNSKDLIILKKA